jgi:tetratricopeptide (TPR) repeat protein
MIRFRNSILGFAVLASAAFATFASRPAPAATAEPLADRARSAKDMEDLGAYTRAVDLLKDLRARTAPDADLELALAIDEARIGRTDSAAARLWGPLLSAALLDTLPLGRRVQYFWGRDEQWTNGTFDGWHWYIARARAEVAAAQGRWDLAAQAAHLAVAAQPLAAMEWQVLAVCEAHLDHWAEATEAAIHAARLDPLLPEPAYLAGLLAWKGGRPHDAERGLRDALRRDSTWTEPALALVRMRLPGVAPDSLPATFFIGPRVVSLLTSPFGPKPESFRQVEKPAVLEKKISPDFPPDLPLDRVPPPLLLSVFLDERGQVQSYELPWLPANAVPEEWIAAVLVAIRRWEFTPARTHGDPQRVWVAVTYEGPKPQ